jgi:cell division protein FtsN
MLAAGEDPNKTIEYDLAKTEEEKAPATKITEKKSRKSALKNNKKAATASARTSTKTKGFFVQVGSFANKANADQTLEKMQSFHEGQIESGTKEKIIYRVLLGPFNNKKEASEILAKITNSGHEAIIVKK